MKKKPVKKPAAETKMFGLCFNPVYGYFPYNEKNKIQVCQYLSHMLIKAAQAPANGTLGTMAYISESLEDVVDNAMKVTLHTVIKLHKGYAGKSKAETLKYIQAKYEETKKLAKEYYEHAENQDKLAKEAVEKLAKESKKKAKVAPPAEEAPKKPNKFKVPAKFKLR